MAERLGLAVIPGVGWRANEIQTTDATPIMTSSGSKIHAGAVTSSSRLENPVAYCGRLEIQKEGRTKC
jgi:hypothetical protein